MRPPHQTHIKRCTHDSYGDEQLDTLIEIAHRVIKKWTSKPPKTSKLIGNDATILTLSTLLQE